MRENVVREESENGKEEAHPGTDRRDLAQIEGAIANHKPTPQACREAAITEQSYYRWRKEYGGLKLEQAKRLKELEKENHQLKHTVAELLLDKRALQALVANKW